MTKLSRRAKQELSRLADRYWTSYEDCLVNAQDLGYEPWSDEEAAEVLRQLRNLVDAGEAR